jgi:hypothetical protein
MLAKLKKQLEATQVDKLYKYFDVDSRKSSIRVDVVKSHTSCACSMSISISKVVMSCSDNFISIEKTKIA